MNVYMLLHEISFSALNCILAHMLKNTYIQFMLCHGNMCYTEAYLSFICKQYNTMNILIMKNVPLYKLNKSMLSFVKTELKQKNVTKIIKIRISKIM